MKSSGFELEERTVTQVLARGAERCPDKPLIKCVTGEEVTYGGLDTLSNRLLVVDSYYNLEQILDAFAPVILQILRSSPEVHLLCTSRERLKNSPLLTLSWRSSSSGIVPVASWRSR